MTVAVRLTQLPNCQYLNTRQRALDVQRRNNYKDAGDAEVELNQEALKGEVEADHRGDVGEDGGEEEGADKVSERDCAKLACQRGAVHDARLIRTDEPVERDTPVWDCALDRGHGHVLVALSAPRP